MRTAGAAATAPAPGPVARSGMNLVIVVAGIVGLAVARSSSELLVDALRRRQFLDVGIAVGIAVLTVWLLFTYGDGLLQ